MLGRPAPAWGMADSPNHPLAPGADESGEWDFGDLLVSESEPLGAAPGYEPDLDGPAFQLIDDAGGRTPEDLPELAIDVFKPMDGGIELTEDEIKGRNTWNLWTGGNEQFWDRVAREGMGNTTIVITGGLGGGLAEEFAPIGREVKKLVPKVKKQFGDWLQETRR